MSDDFLKEIKETFLVEAADLLEQCESNFLSFENNPKDEEILKGIFRLAHNLKGSSKAVGFDELADFAHKFENLLVKIKDGAVEPSADAIDLLLQVNDRLKENVEILSNDVDAVLQNDDLKAKLLQMIESGGGKPAEPQKEEAAPAPEPQAPAIETAPVVQTTSEEDVKPEPTPEATIQPAKIEPTSETTEVIAKPEEKPVTPTPAPKETKAPTQVQTKKQDEFIRISLSKIDNLLNSFGEQVILQSTLEYAKNNVQKNATLINKTISQLSKITYDLQQTAIALRMLSMKNVFAKMERIVRDTKKILGKNITFKMSGENNELDKTIIEAIVDPLTHMIRNSVDHGIEMPEDRIKAGKPEEGTVTLKAFHKGGFFYIIVQDDGKGLDKDKLRAKAIKNGIISESEKLTDQELYNLIFRSGFSTKDSASEISGRGVGMDVVKHAITSLKGECDLDSKLGEGTTFTIRLPLTLAIFNGMVIRIGKSKFIFPNSDIEETINIKEKDIRSVNERENIINIKGNVVSILDISNVLNKDKAKNNQSKNEDKIVLLTSVENTKYALVIDELLSQQRVVHKNLGKEISELPGIAGGTILGDGHVALIIESSNLINHMQKRV